MRKSLYFKSAVALIFFLSFVGYVYAASVRFTVTLSPIANTTISDDSSFNGVVTVKNVETWGSATFITESEFGTDTNIISFSPSTFSLGPQESIALAYTLAVPADYCAGRYKVYWTVIQTSYTGGSGSGSVSVRSAVAERDYITVDSSIDCDSGGGYVFHDVDGDGIYEAGDGDAYVTTGTATIYDSADSALSVTNLSLTGGRYNLPSGGISGTQDYYITVNTVLMDGANLDTSWQGNLFVNRTGTFAARGNVFMLNDISNYGEMTANVDLRSRNTDQSGSWALNTISIGPDDKDQIISPSRWDQLVAGTNFKYADLDHDGRIDPDDKDHIISPLYWDFPN